MSRKQIDPQDGLLAFLEVSSLEELIKMRRKLLEQDIMPTQILIPRAKLLGCDLVFADVTATQMVGIKK